MPVEPCLFVGLRALGRKEQSPGGLASNPLSPCLSRTRLAYPSRALFLFRYELFSVLFTLHLPKELGARWFSCGGYNFIGEKRGFVKQSMELVAPQLLQGLPAPFLESYFCSLKAEISIAVDALPGTLAGLLSLGCSSRNHCSFSLSFVIKARGAFPALPCCLQALGRADGVSAPQTSDQKQPFEKVSVTKESKPSYPQENILQ